METNDLVEQHGVQKVRQLLNEKNYVDARNLCHTLLYSLQQLQNRRRYSKVLAVTAVATVLGLLMGVVFAPIFAIGGYLGAKWLFEWLGDGDIEVVRLRIYPLLSVANTEIGKLKDEHAGE